MSLALLILTLAGREDVPNWFGILYMIITGLFLIFGRWEIIIKKRESENDGGDV